MKYFRATRALKPERHESFRNRVFGVGGNGGICRIVLLRSPITASGRPDVWGAALGNIRRAYKRIAGHRGKYVGIFRRRLDGISQRLRKVNTS